MEAMKKANKKAYKNKLGKIVPAEPDLSLELEIIETKEDKWNALVKKCKDNSIELDGLKMEDHSEEQIQELMEYIENEIKTK